MKGWQVDGGPMLNGGETATRVVLSSSLENASGGKASGHAMKDDYDTTCITPGVNTLYP